MSQYQSPYTPPPDQPPTVGYYAYPPPQDDPLVPARRASTTMFILGALMIVMGVIVAGVHFSGLVERMSPEQRAPLEQLESQVNRPIGEIVLMLAGIFTVPGLICVFLGFFVRRGGLGSIVISIVLTSLLLLMVILNVLGGIAQAGRDPSTVCGLIVAIFILALVIMQLVFLIAAARNAKHVRAMRYYADYWRHQQQPPSPPGY